MAKSKFMINEKGNNSENINFLLHEGRRTLSEALSILEFLKEEWYELSVQERDNLRQKIEEKLLIAKEYFKKVGFVDQEEEKVCQELKNELDNLDKTK